MIAPKIRFPMLVAEARQNKSTSLYHCFTICKEMTRTDLNEMVKAAWPWATSFSKQLHALRSVPFHGSHLMFGSDYSGSHSGSQFRTYGFVIGDADASPEWPARCRESRSAFLAGGRRMAFKSLNDRQRRRALIPFLEASEAP